MVSCGSAVPRISTTSAVREGLSVSDTDRQSQIERLASISLTFQHPVRRHSRSRPQMSTESVLRDWRYGQAQAERMVAALLHLESFESVDPQHPLGGRDGLKDVLCSKDGLSWIAAAYFPPTHPTFADIKNKFEHDFGGVSTNRAQAFAFFVNQPLTIAERQQLQGLAGQTRTEIYHLERLRSLLDAPKGCGVRLEYLRIPMTEEEQWAFWSTMNQDVVRRLVDHEARRDAHFQAVNDKLDMLLERTRMIGAAIAEGSSHLVAGANALENIEMPTAQLSLTTLCWLHRLLTEGTGLPEAVRGRLRSVGVWIGPAGSTSDTATFVPPPPELILARTKEYLEWWRSRHTELQGRPRADIVLGLAELHHRFLRIHPFLDANGRVARAVLDQAARELLNQSVGPEFTSDPQSYYSALRQADLGDLGPLQTRIGVALK
jgi:fido (protein-threonine AMPylation protein)